MIVRRALAKRGAIVVVANLTEAFELANRIAPEHLELDIQASLAMDPQGQERRCAVRRQSLAGAARRLPGGPNHVLPTGGAARFASPLGAYDFLKRTSIIEASAGALRRLGPTVARLARMEGFEGHARAMELRGFDGAVNPPSCLSLTR